MSETKFEVCSICSAGRPQFRRIGGEFDGAPYCQGCFDNHQTSSNLDAAIRYRRQSAAPSSPPSPAANGASQSFFGGACEACGVGSAPKMHRLHAPIYPGDTAGARVCDDCFGRGGTVELIRSRRSPPATAAGPGPCAVYLAKAKALLERYPQATAVAWWTDYLGPYIVIGGVEHYVREENNELRAVGKESIGKAARYIQRSALLATPTPAGQGGKGWDPVGELAKRCEREINQAIAAIAIPQTEEPQRFQWSKVKPDPDSLAARFPMSHGERCGFCSDPIGSHDWVKFGAQKWHGHCAQQSGRRQDAELDAEHEAFERGRIKRLPTCLCGATIFRPFPIQQGAYVRTGCGDCAIKANPQPVAGGSELTRALDRGVGVHPWSAWSTPTYDGEW